MGIRMYALFDALKIAWVQVRSIIKFVYLMFAQILYIIIVMMFSETDFINMKFHLSVVLQINFDCLLQIMI